MQALNLSSKSKGLPVKMPPLLKEKIVAENVRKKKIGHPLRFFKICKMKNPDNLLAMQSIL
jgi:hypothetical protein